MSATRTQDVSRAILGFDLSTPRAVAVLALPDGALRTLFNERMTEHLSWLMPAAHLLLAEAGLRASDLEALAVGKGPGSFTGVRTAVVTAKSMGHILDIPLVAPASLDVLAASIDTEGDAVCACLDARRGELYYAFYVIEGGEPLLEGEHKVGSPNRVAEDCRMFRDSTGRRLSLAGNGLAAYRETLEAALKDIVHFTSVLYPGGEELIGAAHRLLARGETEEPLALTPHYLRLPDSGPGNLGCST